MYTEIHINDENWMVFEPSVEYGEKKYPLQKETYDILGKCFEVHKTLGRGFLEVVYKDALSLEFRKAKIPFEREKKYNIVYKGEVLDRSYVADFVVFNNVILEVKAISGLIEDHIKLAMNYLAVSGCEVALLINFGENSLKYKRVVLSK